MINFSTALAKPACFSLQFKTNTELKEKTKQKPNQ